MLEMEDAPDADELNWVVSKTGQVYRLTAMNGKSKNFTKIGDLEAAKRLKAKGADLKKLGLAQHLEKPRAVSKPKPKPKPAPKPKPVAAVDTSADDIELTSAIDEALAG